MSKFLTDTLGMPPEEAEAELARDPSGYLEKYYRNLNPNATEEEVAEFVTTNTAEYRAEGGRIGFAEGPVLPPDPTQPVNPFGPKPGDFGIDEDIPIKMASYGYNEAMADTYDSYLDMKKKGLIPPNHVLLMSFTRRTEMSKKRMEPNNKRCYSLGGRMGLSEGTNEISIDQIEMLIKRGADNDS